MWLIILETKPIPAYSSLFRPIQAYFGIFLPIPEFLKAGDAGTHVPAKFSLVGAKLLLLNSKRQKTKFCIFFPAKQIASVCHLETSIYHLCLTELTFKRYQSDTKEIFKKPNKKRLFVQAVKSNYHCLNDEKA